MDSGMTTPSTEQEILATRREGQPGKSQIPLVEAQFGLCVALEDSKCSISNNRDVASGNFIWP